MQKFSLALLFSIFFLSSFSQTPKTYTSSEIMNQLKKLNVLGSVLYIAAHPDDENTRLLAYLANDRLYRTGYLSITRGDGGQNLIGDEQGIELGLIRTQELLAARRIDGAEQFFSRGYDFGFSKSPDEAFRIWDKQKILSDVVYVIRKFKPDVIICRFPTTGEGGHGHHTASAILAEEAFSLAGDPTKFPEQLKNGVEVWQPKRLLWNVFNANANNPSPDLLKIDDGGYNALLGKSYGEIAAESRSMHKSQGFGVSRSRGSQLDYFKTIKGDAPKTGLFDDVNTDWNRINAKQIQAKVNDIIQSYSFDDPSLSVKPLVRLYSDVSKLPESYWRSKKLSEIAKLVEACSGLYLEATTAQPFAVRGDSLNINTVVNNRGGVNVKDITVIYNSYNLSFPVAGKNSNVSGRMATFVNAQEPLSIPYWLQKPLAKGSFDVTDQQLIGLPENEPLSAAFKINIEGQDFTFVKPVLYKSNDPVKGELYQPVNIVAPVSITAMPEVSITREGQSRNVSFLVKNYADVEGNFRSGKDQPGVRARYLDWPKKLPKGSSRVMNMEIQNVSQPIQEKVFLETNGQKFSDGFKVISYNHIPDILVPTHSSFTVKPVNFKIGGKRIGYIAGAGDKVPESLTQMGYFVVMLQQKDITASNIKNLNAIVTGVRAYNVHEWLSDAYDVLMNYVNEGGVLLVQYNTNNNIGPVKAKISPFPFTISRNRITDEEAAVTFIDPEHPVLNYPNKITPADFEGWIQERSVYNAEGFDKNYTPIFSMTDPGEQPQTGALIVADYGKGKFVYSALAFFRQLPAGVTGAYKLFANLLAK